MSSVSVVSSEFVIACLIVVIIPTLFFGLCIQVYIPSVSALSTNEQVLNYLVIRGGR